MISCREKRYPWWHVSQGSEPQVSKPISGNRSGALNDLCAGAHCCQLAPALRGGNDPRREPRLGFGQDIWDHRVTRREIRNGWADRDVFVARKFGGPFR